MSALTEEVLYTKAIPHKWATNTTTMTEEEGIEASPSEGSRAGVSTGIVVLAASFLPFVQTPPRTPTVVVLERFVDQIGIANETADFMVPLPGQREASESGQPLLRGTFAPPSGRDVLFTVSLDLESSHLRRWNPEVFLDRRSLDQEDA